MKPTRFHIAHDFAFWNATILINMDDPVTEAAMKETVLFFMGGQDLLDECDGVVVKAYLQTLAPALCLLASSFGDTRMSQQEGFFPLDGSRGVSLVQVDRWEFERDDFTIKQEGGEPE